LSSTAQQPKDNKTKPKRITQPTPTPTKPALCKDKLNAELALLEHKLQELDAKTENNEPTTSDAPSDEDAMDEEEEIIFSPSSSSDNSSEIPLPPLPPSALKQKHDKRPKQKVTVTTTETSNEPTVPIDTTNTPDEPDMDTTIETTQTVPHIDNKCRYSLIITVPPSNTPWPKFAEILRKCLKLLQDQLNKNVWIAWWDNENDGVEKIIKCPKDIPEGKVINRKRFSHYFSGFPNPKKNQSSKVFLKVRLITETNPLNEIGPELSVGIPDELPAHLGCNPYACQGVKLESLGWLYGSIKSVDSNTFAKQLKLDLQLAENVAIFQQDRETRAMVAENLFGIGTSWKIEAPIMWGIARRPAKTAANNRANDHPVSQAASQAAEADVAAATAAIHSRTINSDVRSFGFTYGRIPDDESIATNLASAEDNANEVEEPSNVVIQLDPNLPDNQLKEHDNDAHLMAASSAGFTRDSTRSKLQEQTKVNDLLHLQYADFEEAQEEAIPCHSRRGIKRKSIMTHSWLIRDSINYI
jgi:hypothetical protein